MSVKLNTRKSTQYFPLDNSRVVNTDVEYIHVVYRDKTGLHDEVFKDETLEDIEAIYENFNRTLKPDESKRSPLAYFKRTVVFKYEKIKL